MRSLRSGSRCVSTRITPQTLLGGVIRRRGLIGVAASGDGVFPPKSPPAGEFQPPSVPLFRGIRGAAVIEINQPRLTIRTIETIAASQVTNCASVDHTEAGWVSRDALEEVPERPVQSGRPDTARLNVICFVRSRPTDRLLPWLDPEGDGLRAGHTKEVRSLAGQVSQNTLGPVRPIGQNPRSQVAASDPGPLDKILADEDSELRKPAVKSYAQFGPRPRYPS